MSGFDPARLERLRATVSCHVEEDAVAGVAWLAARGHDVEVGLAGTLERGKGDPVRRDTRFPAFGRILLAGGRLPGGSRLLSRATVAAMTTDQLGPTAALGGPQPDGGD